jgi:hypothetical protein
MSMVGAFDVHRRQLTFEYLDTVTGELVRGRVVPADREHLREWLARFTGQPDVAFALEGCTGWRYVLEELLAAGIEPYLAEPADTAALRGKKRHAKTDKTDTRHLRVHLLAGDLPESWIPPHVPAGPAAPLPAAQATLPCGCVLRPPARSATAHLLRGAWVALGRSLVGGARLLLAETARPAGLTGRMEKQIDPHSVTIPLRPRREYGVFDSGGRTSHREARPTQVSFDLRVDVPARQRHAASHLAPTAVWSRNDGRTA